MFFRKEGGYASKHYTGRSSHTYIERMMRSSRKLMIVSPFVDAYYAEFLRNISHGRKIMLLSSSMDYRAAKVLGRRPRPLAFISIAALLVILDAAEFYVNILTVASVLATIFLVLVFAVFLLRGKGSVMLRRPGSFVHMKLYISEKEAIQGSANLTYSGMHRNVEHIEVIHDPEVIGQLRNDFMKLWRDAT